MSKLNVQILHLRQQLSEEKARLSAQKLCSDDFKLNFFTGIPNCKVFQWLLSLFENFTFTYYPGKNVLVLSREDQLLMTLMRLRRGFQRLVLAEWFSVSVQTVTNVTHTWIDALHSVLFESTMSEVPSLAKNKATLPKCFEEFSDRMILDCTEVRVPIPSSMKLHNLVYSQYKHYTTFKGLIGVAPNGACTFVSKLYPGSTSDKAVVRDSGVVNVFLPGESVMVDKGFLISEMLPQGVRLVRPPFLTSIQFTSEQVRQSKTISRSRIHVERANERVKIFKVLDFIPASIVTISSKIFQVCAALTNLMTPLIKEVEEAMKAEGYIDPDSE